MEKDTSSQDEARQVQRLGKTLVTQLQILLKTAQIHDPTNAAVETAAGHVMETIGGLQSLHEETTLRMEQEALFLGETKLKMEMDALSSFLFVMEEMKRRGVGSIALPSTISQDELKKFIYLFVSTDPRGPAPFEELNKVLASEGLSTIMVDRAGGGVEGVGTVSYDPKDIAIRLYFRAFAVLTKVMEDAEEGKTLGLVRAKRVVQGFVDQVLKDEAPLLGLTTLCCHEEYTHYHSINVCILSLALGKRVGLNRKRLSELGMAALLHDIGKAVLPHPLLQKTEEFTEEEWHQVRRHPVGGVRTLIVLKGVNDSTINIMRGAYEHHLRLDNTGYPPCARAHSISLFGRIIAIADAYDALVSSRVYRRTPVSPPAALRALWEEKGKAHDPVLLSFFIWMMGVYPLGSLVLLDTKEVGVVMRPNPDPSFADRPSVKLLMDRNWNAVDGDVVDLVDKSPDGSCFTRTIERAIAVGSQPIDTTRYFL